MMRILADGHAVMQDFIISNAVVSVDLKSYNEAQHNVVMDFKIN